MRLVSMPVVQIQQGIEGPSDVSGLSANKNRGLNMLRRYAAITRNSRKNPRIHAAAFER